MYHSRGTFFNVPGFVIMALGAAMFGWLGPSLEFRGYPGWALLAKIFGGLLCGFSFLFSFLAVYG